MDAENELKFVRKVEANPAAVYRAFTNTAAIRSWLCDNAQLDARENGRLYLHWNRGYYASGEFTVVEPDAALGFTWQGRNEPAATTVKVTFAAENGGTNVTLIHAEVDTSTSWEETREELKKGWETGLTNLKSVLETGLDKRVYDRPFIGIFLSGLVSDEQAKRLGIPVSHGILIGGTVADTGAEAAGLKADDVLTSLDGVDLESFQALTDAIAGHNAGDLVDLQFYRAGRKHEVAMQLSHRPRPEVPATTAEFAANLRQLHADLDAELDSIVSGISESQASQSIEGEWNAREVLAHLMLNERTVQMNLVLQIGGQTSAPYATNSEVPFAALTTVFPKFTDMIKAWKQIEAETVALVERLPDEFVARKVDYLSLGNSLLLGLPAHTRGHIIQIRDAVLMQEES